ncbi:MAG: septation ring formation regulator EzrA [Carnobacterium sp.]|uniref:Septation ring formation regulator EzrA n=1 Tax=Carnobacterium antarcticum TaxID=2126436 RepID=A0ABW4NQ35_9LACT|nr:MULTISPECIES: septation ring formation regulator EzrA [unclassified Carnobacterium]ALV20821.1 Septation ring formation regulator EzrA [Carnobacterium sp. CP1]QQP70981.1 septation ring formation regulator EzrA [Carnobacterium sp. CS13]
MSFEYILIAIILLAVIAYGTSYLMKKKHYAIIDALEKQKLELMELPVIDDLHSAKDLQLTGQTEETFKKLKAEWQKVETTTFPDLENCLFDAEQATDRLQLVHAKKAETKAAELIEGAKITIADIQEALKELLKSEEKNLLEVKRIQETYQEIRKKLLTQSFSFGPALEKLEKKLTFLEVDFSKIEELTALGDHIEAKKVLSQVDLDTKELNHLIKQVPGILKELTTEFAGQIEELKEGYEQLIAQKFVFLDDTILDDIEAIEKECQVSERLIADCELEEAKMKNREIEENINHLYDIMELEIEAKEFIVARQPVLDDYIEFVLEKNRKLLIEIDRVAQSYALNNDELAKTQTMQEELLEIQNNFDTFTDGLNNHQAVFSAVQESYTEHAKALEQIEGKQKEINDHLIELREEEMEVKAKIDDFEFNLRGVKRYIEKQHLPGLPTGYLDFFFATTERIEELSKELNKLRIDMKDIKKLCDLCDDDVELLIEKTEDIVDSAMLTEYMMQYANRYRHTHPEISSAITESFALFNQEFEYQEALETISTALEEVEPGAFKKVEESYLEDKQKKR